MMNSITNNNNNCGYCLNNRNNNLRINNNKSNETEKKQMRVICLLWIFMFAIYKTEQSFWERKLFYMYVYIFRKLLYFWYKLFNQFRDFILFSVKNDEKGLIKIFYTTNKIVLAN